LSEGGRPGGLNTSVMLWRAHDPRLAPVYTEVDRHVVTVVRKLDWWVEMLVERERGRSSSSGNDIDSSSGAAGVISLQEWWPGLVTDSQQAVASMVGNEAACPPPTAAVIVFPLRPKPAELVDTVPWVREHWK
jgi:hypothetical protein